MASKKKNTAQIISLDAFGSAKDYWLCWIKSPLSHLSFATSVQRHFGYPCAYIGDVVLDDVHPDLKFPMYFTTFNVDYDVNLVILSNHTTAPTSLSLEQQNPLFGGLLFADEYYLFNNQGLTKINFSYPQADYLLLLSTDKQADISDYSALLPQIPNIQVLCQNTPQMIAEGQKKSKQVLDFLQYLFYESEAAVKEYRQRKLSQKLHHKMSVAEANYGYLRFPVEDNRTITSNLLRREDY
ncbi:MAG: hypothetical protein PUB29_03655 [Bacteroidales bacterium]|nr:hypothetical protein [Bacteroidales bacterium]